jgi:hypothetical protein
MRGELQTLRGIDQRAENQEGANQNREPHFRSKDHHGVRGGFDFLRQVLDYFFG